MLPQCTEEDHDDKQDLIKAKVLMSDVAASINESKRRKDIVDKYRSEETDKTLTRKIAKFSMHSLNKKSNRYVHFTLSLHFIRISSVSTYLKVLKICNGLTFAGLVRSSSPNWASTVRLKTTSFWSTRGNSTIWSRRWKTLSGLWESSTTSSTMSSSVSSTSLTTLQVAARLFFSPVLRHQEQQNFRNLEFRREILEFSEISFQFDGGNLEFPLSLEEKSCIWAKKPWV